MVTNYLVLDVSTAAIPDAAQYLDPVTAPANYRDPAKIAEYVAEKQAEQASRAGLDVDLCQITGAAIRDNAGFVAYRTREHNDEPDILAWLDDQMHGLTLVSYNGLKFDWPVLMRRALYLGVPFQPINLDRYRTSHVDVFDRLTNHGALPGRSLRFYANRFGWLDLDKPLSGAEEARVLETHDWRGLESSLIHDVTMCGRLAQRIGLIR